MPGQLTIGRFASAAGVSRDTVRYYQRLRLLSGLGRNGSGYRVFSDEDIERVRFIKLAQGIGLSLDEIKQLLPDSRDGRAECRKVRDVLRAKLRDVESRLSDILTLRESVKGYLEQCEKALASDTQDGCPVVAKITRKSLKKLSS